MPTTFENLIGNPQNKQILLHLIRSDEVPQVLLFYGPEGVGKKKFAEALARSLLPMHGDSHSDLLEFFPESKTFTHTMASMRMLIKEASLPPLESTRRIFIIHDIDRLMEYSGNALLKTLEEPNPFTLFLLLTSQCEEVLPTILSRVQKLPFFPLSDEEIGEWLKQYDPKAEVKTIAPLAQGSLKQAKLLCEENTLQEIEETAQLFLARDLKSIMQKIPNLEKIPLELLFSLLMAKFQGSFSMELLIEASTKALQAEKSFVRKKTCLEWFFLQLVL